MCDFELDTDDDAVLQGSSVPFCQLDSI